MFRGLWAGQCEFLTEQGKCFISVRRELRVEEFQSRSSGGLKSPPMKGESISGLYQLTKDR